jgi:putative ABC transport system substrate-binding protein
MKRRPVLLGIAGCALWLPAAFDSIAQRAKLPVVGLLDAGERPAWWAAFRKQMNELGYTEGKSIAFELRFAKGRYTDLPALAEELIRLRVDVIVTAGTEASIAASRMTDKVPIVTATGGDHVSRGLAASLGQPGGNVTGMTSIASELTGKRLELLREIHPRLQRLAVIWQSNSAGPMAQFRDLEATARLAKIALHNLGIRKASELTEAFSSAAQKGADASYVIFGPLIYAERHSIAALALKHRLPNMHGSAEMVEAGGLACYGTDYRDLFRRAAIYVDKILKGAKPGELAIEQPSKFDLLINLRTAKALGLAIPQAVLLRASRVID